MKLREALRGLVPLGRPRPGSPEPSTRQVFTSTDSARGDSSVHLVKIAVANSGIDEIDALAGRTVEVLATGIDSDLECWLEVWADQRRVLVYERDLELISMA